jgi:hypothetical protein
VPLSRQGRGEIETFLRSYSQLVDQDNERITHLQEERNQLTKELSQT